MDVKIRIPQRDQMIFRSESLDEMLTPDHPARAIWEFTEKLDFSAWMSKIRSRPGEVGAKAHNPRVLLTLWILATLDGVRSAREVARLTEDHTAYRWVCGDEPVNYHTVSDFRRSDPAAFEELLAESVATLTLVGAASLKQVAQDGVRVRANAGASSFRREATLRQLYEEAKQQIAALNDDDHDDDDEDKTAGTPRQSAARKRAASERKERVEAALERLKELQAENASRRPCRQKEPSELRVSTTDPDATKMKMADGGYRPAYNVQFATTVEGGAIVGVAVTDEGVDSAQMEPMIEKIESLHGERPETYLVDGGFVDQEAIGRVEESHTRVLAPVPRMDKWIKEGKDPFARRPDDTDAVANWRARMGTDDGREQYKRRASTAEWVNAQARNHGLRQFLVRGIERVLSSTFLYAIAHNFQRYLAWKRVQPA